MGSQKSMRSDYGSNISVVLSQFLQKVVASSMHGRYLYGCWLKNSSSRDESAKENIYFFHDQELLSTLTLVCSWEYMLKLSKEMRLEIICDVADFPIPTLQVR
jgi:hypothetical protein